MVRAIRRHSCPSSCCRTIFSFLFCMVCRPFSIWRLSTRDASSRGVEIAGVFCRRVDETPRGEASVNTTGERDGVYIGQRMAMSNFSVIPRGMEGIVTYVKEKYNNTPLFITENGPIDNSLNDTERYSTTRAISPSQVKLLEKVRR